MIRIAPSLLAANFMKLGEEIARMAAAGADFLHYDVMDGRFVPNISFGIEILRQAAALKLLPMDVHLMIDSPEKYIDAFADAGARVITVHAEATDHLHSLLNQIRRRGCLAGVALNPATPPEALSYVLPEIDLALVMTVNPGFGGQKLIPEAVRKVSILREMFSGAGIEPLIEVDGGVGPGNARMLTEQGANVLVAGSALFSAEDPAEVMKRMRGAGA